MARGVGEYYDRNTRRFLRFGGAGTTGAIHRAIWAPGVASAEEAFLYLNRLVAVALRPALEAGEPPGRVLDLGCGVGGTSTWLAAELGAEVVGVANSPVQLEIARRRARELGLEGRCRFLLGDFLDLPPLGPAQGACAIESFVHAADPAGFFRQVAAQLAPGGRLVICDDFLAEPLTDPGQRRRAEAWLGRFRGGWGAHSLVEEAAALELAGQAGLRSLETVDLTGFLRGFRPLLLYPLAALTRLPLRSAYWRNLAGGTALQVCVRRGYTRYLALVFEK